MCWCFQPEEHQWHTGYRHYGIKNAGRHVRTSWFSLDSTFKIVAVPVNQWVINIANVSTSCATGNRTDALTVYLKHCPSGHSTSNWRQNVVIIMAHLMLNCKYHMDINTQGQYDIKKVLKNNHLQKNLMKTKFGCKKSLVGQMLWCQH